MAAIPKRITIGVSPKRPTRSFGFSGAPPALGSPPVCAPGGGRNWSVSARTDDPFGLTGVPAPDVSAGTTEVDSDGAVEIEAGRAVGVDSRRADVESGRAVGTESGCALVESCRAVEIESGRAVVESAFAAAVDAWAALPPDASQATATTNTRKCWRSRHAARRRIRPILDDARSHGDAKISAERGSLRSDPGRGGFRHGSGAEDRAACSTTTLPCAPSALGGRG